MFASLICTAIFLLSLFSGLSSTPKVHIYENNSLETNCQNLSLKVMENDLLCWDGKVDFNGTSSFALAVEIVILRNGSNEYKTLCEIDFKTCIKSNSTCFCEKKNKDGTFRFRFTLIAKDYNSNALISGRLTDLNENVISSEQIKLPIIHKRKDIQSSTKLDDIQLATLLLDKLKGKTMDFTSLERGLTINHVFTALILIASIVIAVYFVRDKRKQDDEIKKEREQFQRFKKKHDIEVERNSAELQEMKNIITHLNRELKKLRGKIQEYHNDDGDEKQTDSDESCIDIGRNRHLKNLDQNEDNQIKINVTPTCPVNEESYMATNYSNKKTIFDVNPLLSADELSI